MGAPIQWEDEWILNNISIHSTYSSLAKAYSKQFNCNCNADSLNAHCRLYLNINKDRRVDWDDDWLVANYLNYPSYTEMAENYNRIKGTSVTTSAIKLRCHNKLGLSKPRTYICWSSEEDQWLIDNYPSLGIRESVSRLNQLFDNGRTYMSVKNRVASLKIQCEEDVLTQLKIANHILPDGSMHTESSKRVYIKVNGNWIPYSRYLWEQTYGELPAGYVVKYLDNDVTNNTIANLMAIPRKYLGMLSINNLMSTNPTLTRAGILWCDLQEAVKK